MAAAAVAVGAAGQRNRQNANDSSNNSDEDCSQPQFGGDASGRPTLQKVQSSTIVKAEADDTDARKLRLAIWNGLGDPSSSRTAYAFFVLILTLILLSCCAFVVETIPAYCCGRYDNIFSNIELVCVIAFTLEYMARLVVVPASVDNEGLFACEDEDGFKAELLTRVRFFLKPFNIVDFAAIFPWYLELIMVAANPGAPTLQGTSFLRVIRLARVFRLFKLSKYSDGMWLLTATLVRSWRALGMLSFFMLISVILFSSIMYFAEKGRFFYCSLEAATASPPLCRQSQVWSTEPTLGAEMQSPLHECAAIATKEFGHDYALKCCDGEGFYVWPPLDVDVNGCLDRSNYDSIFSTAWWCVVTMTTVGYGDSYPHSTLGKIFAIFTMLSGILILALPITVIGSNFNIEYEKSEAEARMKRQLLLAQDPAAAEEEEEQGPDRVDRPHATGTSHKALLAAVEKLLSEQREYILRRAEDMISQHVREITKEVVIQAHSSAMPKSRSKGNFAEAGAAGSGRQMS